MMIAGAPSKSAPVIVKSKQIAPGVWIDQYSDGSVVRSADLTSALWRYGSETKSKPQARR